MLAVQRRSRILDQLERDGTVRVADLVTLLGVSDMTIRRDLQVMDREGLLEKVHGGATVRSAPSSLEPGLETRSTQRLSEKNAIAARAASLVRPGSAIAISAGTTAHAFAHHLVGVPDLTIVTNSITVSDVLHGHGREPESVLLTGGWRTASDALVGPVAIAALESLHVDTVFTGVHGMDSRAGFTTPNLLEAETNRAMIRSGRRMIVLADSTKWGVVGLSSMAKLSQASMIISDTGLPDHVGAQLSEQCEELVLVSPEGGEPT